MLLIATAGLATANPRFVVDAGAGADLVIWRDASSIFDSEAVPPSNSANIYAKLNGGDFLNTGNTNASLAYSFTVNDGDVLSLHRNSWGFTAVSVYGFDLLSGNASTLLYNGAVSSSNVNTGGSTGPALAPGVPWEVTDPHDGSVWRLTFNAATTDSTDMVGNTYDTPGLGADRVDTITFTKVPPPAPADPKIQIAAYLRHASDGNPMTITVPFSNSGLTQSLEITSVTLSGSGAAAFAVDAFTPSLAPGGSGNIQLTYTPAGHGSTHVNVRVVSNDSSQPTATVSLRVDTTDGSSMVAGASALWTRLAGAQAAGRFDFSVRAAVDGKDTYTLAVIGGRVKVAGSSGVAMARGAYDYLRAHGYGMIGWAGSRVELPATLPDLAETTVTPPGALQTYFNPVVFGYSTPYWDWARWEREIDLMAIHGINLPLALTAQEAVGERVWKRLGLTQTEINTFMTGPAHLPWQRMGNVCNHDGSLPASWHRDQITLQHQILGRMRTLGIQPVVPAFAGFVPAALPRVSPGVSLVQTLWNSGFPASKRPWFLLPTDPMFPKIAAMYQQEWRDEFGAADYFLCDSFNEMQIPTNGQTLAETLANFGELIYGTLTATDPNAVWFLQGWMFGYQRNIWNNDTVAALLSRLPDDGVIVQDIACDYNANYWHNGMNWQLFNAFHGKRWTHGVIPNMGGHTAPTGIMSFYASDATNAYANPASGRLSGAGYAAEGLESNEVLFELTTDAAWSTQPLNLDDWIRRYCINRYGACPPAMEQAWSLLRQTVYGTFSDQALGWQRGSPGYASVYRDERIQQAVNTFLSCRNVLGASPLYQADALEFTAFALGLHADQRFVRARDAFAAADASAGEAYLAQGLRLLDELDRLLASHPTLRLDRWLNFSRGFGDTAGETNAFEANARRIITSWGPPVNDYACRIWSGLVRDFYKPRMAAWFQAYRAGQSFNVNAWEQTWISASGVSPVTPYNDPVASAAAALTVAIDESAQAPPDNADEVIGDWVPGQLQTTWTPIEWTITSDQLRRMAGVVFDYQSGANRLEIQRVEIVADGVVVASLDQFGIAGSSPVNHIYRIVIPGGVQSNNTLVLRASVRGNGGTDSRGRVLLLSNVTAGPAVIKAATGTGLTDAASWSGGRAPAADEIATWSGASLGAGLVLDAPASWQGMAITGAASDVSVAGPASLTLGAMGIDLSTSAVNATLTAPLVLGDSQTWRLVAGRTLACLGPITGTGDLTIQSQAMVSSYDAYLPIGTEPALAYPNVSLASVTGAAGKMGGARVNYGTPINGTVCYFSNNGSTATYQLQATEGVYTKCVKVELTQAGSQVMARALYAKYITAINIGFNFDTGGTSNNLASGPTGEGYGATMNQLISGEPSAGFVRLEGAASHAGRTVVTDGTLELTAGARLAFRVSDSAANTLSGNGNAVLNGDFAIDVAAVTRTSGDWRLEDVSTLTGAYGPSFRVLSPDGVPWMDLGADMWRKDSGLLRFTFEEATGSLSVQSLNYSSWRDTHAAGESLEDDHDRDGVPNGIEYFMGLAGHGFTANPAPGSSRLVSWPKAKGYTGVYGSDFVVQSSTDLNAWSDVASDQVVMKEECLEYTLPAGNLTKFVRLKVRGP